jgi:hypothetical protein
LVITLSIKGEEGSIHKRASKQHGFKTAAFDAQSVSLPESVIPSAGAMRLFPEFVKGRQVLLPESFLGGCSFGVSAKLISPKPTL